MFHNNNRLETILLRIIEYGTWATLFSPLVFATSYFFPFIVPKTIFFRIIVDIIFIAYLILLSINEKYRPKVTPLTIAISIFITITFLASLFGVNFTRSFWSVFERMIGVLTLLHLFVFYIILTSCFNKKEYWERILLGSIIVSFVVCIINLNSNSLYTRQGSTLGNSSFFASYLLFNIFFASMLMVWKKGWWRILSASALIIFLYFLFFNEEVTRGAVSAFLIGAGLFLVGYLFFSDKPYLKRLSLPVLALLITVGLFVVKVVYFKDRSFNILEIPDKSRQIVWHIGFEAWKERFWLGWGLENFNIPFAKYYNPKLPATGDAWYDRVHNIILDTAVSSGLIGILSYLSIFFTSIAILWKNVYRELPQRDKRGVVFNLLLGISLIVYFLQNLWVFDTVSSYLMFFLTLSLINFSSGGIVTKLDRKLLDSILIHRYRTLFTLLLITLSIITLYFGNVRPALASIYILSGSNSLNLESSINYFQKAYFLTPMARFEVPEKFSMSLARFSLRDKEQQSSIYYAFQFGEHLFERSLSVNQTDLRMHLFFGSHALNFYRLTADPTKLTKARLELEKSIELSPLNQQVYFNLADLFLLEGKKDDAISILRKAKELDPQYINSRIILVLAYKIVGDTENMKKELEEFAELRVDWRKLINESDIFPEKNRNVTTTDGS